MKIFVLLSLLALMTGCASMQRQETLDKAIGMDTGRLMTLNGLPDQMMCSTLDEIMFIYKRCGQYSNGGMAMANAIGGLGNSIQGVAHTQPTYESQPTQYYACDLWIFISRNNKIVMASVGDQIAGENELNHRKFYPLDSSACKTEVKK